MLDKKIITQVNLQVSLEDLFKQYFDRSDIRVGRTTLCPFHTDTRKSAKLYGDNALFCFAEYKMYRPYDALRFLGWSDEKIAELIKVEVEVPQIEKRFIPVDDLRILFRKEGNLNNIINKFYGEKNG